MNRDTSTLVSWDDVAEALDDVEPVLLPADAFRVEGGWREFWLGVVIMLGGGLMAGLCLVGAWTVARWMWGAA